MKQARALAEEEIKQIAWPEGLQSGASTDQANARRIWAFCEEDLRYCPDFRRWLIWDGQRWKVSEVEEAVWLASQVGVELCSLYEIELARASREQSKAEEKARRDRAEIFLRSGVRLRQHSGARAALEVAKGMQEFLVSAEELDADPYLFNAANGTIDLRTGALRPHARADLLTMISPIPFDPEAACPRWEAFLQEISLGRQDMVQFLQRAAGYTLTGSVKEQAFFICYGSGQNGKTTFLNMLAEIMGEYAKTSDASTFLRDGNNGPSNDLARLRGARLVTVRENTEKRVLSDIIKRVSGDDFLTARFLYAEFFEFRAKFKVWFGVDKRPGVDGGDFAIWRRLRFIPFDYRVPEERRDRDLPEKLSQEASGILAWAVRGCLDWQSQGLGTIPSAEEDRELYQLDMDPLGEYLSQRCLIGEAFVASAEDLYADYLNWCAAQHQPPITRNAFGRRLGERFRRKRMKHGSKVIYLGIGLKANGDAEDLPF